MTNTQLLNKTIQSLGIIKRYKGYKQLMMSVELALDDEERLMYITKKHLQSCCGYVLLQSP